MAIIKNWSKNISDKVYKHSSGVYTLLPYTKNTLNVLVKIFRKAMNKLEAEEILMPSMVNLNMFKRRIEYNEIDFLKTTKNMILTPTAEEIAITLPLHHTPRILYQIQTKFRNEIRTSYGLIRNFEFLMKDCYIIDKNKLSLLSLFRKIMNSYNIIFKMFNINSVSSVANGTEIGGKHSFELLAYNLFNYTNVFHVPVRALTRKDWHNRWISFTSEYVSSQKIILGKYYLNCKGIEIAHTFVFNKLKSKDVWLASLGVGLSRLIGYLILNHNLCPLLKVIIISNYKPNYVEVLKGYPRYIYCILISLKYKSVLFESVETSKIRGIKKLNTKLLIIINIIKQNYLLKINTSNLRREATIPVIDMIDLLRCER
ncbi:MAG: aminoacyl--tRNA ligase-related protein [Candidatus Hodgkinia cicadicola]